MQSHNFLIIAKNITALGEIRGKSPQIALSPTRLAQTSTHHVDGKIWCELVVAAHNNAKLKIWNIKIPDKNHLLVTILASC